MGFQFFTWFFLCLAFLTLETKMAVSSDASCMSELSFVAGTVSDSISNSIQYTVSSSSCKPPSKGMRDEG